jgi:hypothetical protein
LTQGRSFDETIFLQLAQMLREHLMRNLGMSRNNREGRMVGSAKRRNEPGRDDLSFLHGIEAGEDRCLLPPRLGRSAMISSSWQDAFTCKLATVVRRSTSSSGVMGASAELCQASHS